MVLIGDSVYCFGDGVLIVLVFLVDMCLGLVVVMLVLAYEVLYYMGDLVVLR